MLLTPKTQKCIALFLLVQFLSTTFSPTVSLALTSGPSQPEFSSFEPVSSSNMVDEFTGDFTYNLPVLEVPGPHGSSYPLSLSYHGGVTPEEEASWVGFGWTLNAGAINRGTRGLPDDFNGKDVTFHNKMPKNWTATVGGGASFGEVFGKDLKGIIGASVNGSIRYNNYRGFGYNIGTGISLGRGLVSMGYNVSDGTGSYSLNTNPFALLNYSYGQKTKYISANKERYLDKGFYKGFKDRNRVQLGGSSNLSGSTYGMFSYTETAKPGIVHAYSGKSYNVSVGITGNPSVVPAGGSVNVFGSYAYQVNTPSITTPGYGYLYSSGAGSNALMDYHVENEKDFNPRDVFLGVPFNDADNFMVSGEGIGGGFRLFNKKAGHFGPREMSSTVEIINVGGDIGAGWTFGAGADAGKGESKLSVSNWNKTLSSFEDPKTSTQDEPVFFRFNNDLGGEWGDAHDDSPIQASLSGSTPSLSPEYFSYNTGNKRSGRSSYIGYHTNSEMLSSTNGGTLTSSSPPNTGAYSRITHVNSISGRWLNERADLIGEIAVFNEGGVQYNYGLPVYSRNESSLNYSVRGVSSIEGNYLAYTNTLNDEVKIGEEKKSQYASTYLLTEILTSDYNDHGLAGNGEYGSSPDDAGGYTRFNYKNVYEAGTGDWYDWRAPYKGLQYNKGSHSDPLDDTGGFSEGEKELYYLHSVETKTHVALFYTSLRDDSREAPADAHKSTAGMGAQQLEKLDKIELYTISDFEQAGGKLVRETWGSPRLNTALDPKPVKTVFFEYNNVLSGNLPNASPGAGKLTLKRVYFEYNRKDAKLRISPYEFSYEYPNYATYPDKYRSGADDVTADYKDLPPAAQNPPYNRFFSDPWGNYQINGETRFSSLRPWVDQRINSNKGYVDPVTSTTVYFDPAAWHLKKITLPSGGQIHVQYEQDDYNYVQDQEAHVMVTLKAKPEGSPLAPDRYYLNLSSIGILTGSQTDELVRLINKRYVDGGKKMYFKMLYSLISNLTLDPLNPLNLAPGKQALDPNTCNVDYITGYASLSGCGKSNGEVWVAFKSDQRLPQQVCEDFVKAERLGKILPGQNCNPSMGLSDGSDPKSVVLQLHSMVSNIIVPRLCQTMSEENSYLRVPTPLAKKGGGVRVKRLMMFTNDLEEGAPVLYGNEYIYKTLDDTREISSGVATNEPGTIREENILTDFIARKHQGNWSKIVAGRDKDKAEGPLGESILPGPSVGYSRVIVKNIHSGKSTVGFSISDFYTAKDYPVRLAHPDNAETMTTINSPRPDKKNLTTPFYSDIKSKTRATQGFSFVLNNMHGQARSTAGYNLPFTSISNIGKGTAVSSTSYEYFEPGKEIPVMSSLFGGVTNKNPGREVDITFAQRQVTEKQNDVNVEADFQITIIPLAFIVLVIPYPTAIPAFSNVEGELSTHSTSKVIRYPAILKKVEIYQNGITHTEENLGFDEYTGKPVAVRSSDEFKGAYLSQSIPASWQYKTMGGKWSSENKSVEGGFTFSANTIQVTAGSCSLAEFTAGDKIRLGPNASTTYYHITGVDWLNNRLSVEPVVGSSLASGSYSRITIVSSGRTNQLQQQAGSITAHDEIKANLAPISVDATQRYEINDYAAALKEKTKDLSSGTGTFNLPGDYTLMNMSAFADKLSGCNADLTQATVREMQYKYSVSNGQITIDLMSFKIKCSESPEIWTTIAAEGWQ